MPTPAQRQKLWPLFGAAIALAGFGFYFVFFRGTRVTERPVDEPPTVSAVPTISADVDADGGPTTFVVKPGDRDWQLALRQTVTRSSGDQKARPLTTSIGLGVHDASLNQLPADDETGETFDPTLLYFDRTYHDAVVVVQEHRRRVGGGITHEVERLIDSASHRVALAHNGKVVDYLLTSTEAAQLEELFALMRDAMDILSPTFPREPINPGESWTRRIPIDSELSDDASVSVEGDIVLKSTFVGMVQRGGHRQAAVKAEISSRGNGTIVPEDAEDQPRVGFTQHGGGKGVYYFDLADGALDDSQFRYRARTKFADDRGSVDRVVEMKLHRK